MRIRIEFQPGPVILSPELLSVLPTSLHLAVVVAVMSGVDDQRAICDRWFPDQDEQIYPVMDDLRRLGIVGPLS